MRTISSISSLGQFSERLGLLQDGPAATWGRTLLLPAPFLLKDSCSLQALTGDSHALCCNSPGSKNINSATPHSALLYNQALESYFPDVVSTCSPLLALPVSLAIFSFSENRSKTGSEDSQVLYIFWESTFFEILLSSVCLSWSLRVNFSISEISLPLYLPPSFFLVEAKFRAMGALVLLLTCMCGDELLSLRNLGVNLTHVQGLGAGRECHTCS